MKEMTLREIQLMALDIVKDIHAFCVENGIKYTLAYGSLIGAIRHEGFIPWDDDIDIWMPRPDFDRFCKLYKKREYTLKSIYNNDSDTIITRVYDTRKTVTKQSRAFCNTETGVWVDVMVLDGAPDENEYSKHYSSIRKYYTGFQFFRQHKGENLIECAKILCKKIICAYRTVIGHNKDWWVKGYMRLCEKYKFGETKLCANYGCHSSLITGKNEFFNTSSFTEEYIPHKFEDTQLYIIKDYDAVLTYIYGDYMKLPPIEQREYHSKFVRYYWK